MRTEEIIFYVLAIVIVFFSIMAVKSRLVVRAATYLLFVLLATAGLYLILDYTFLFAVQTSVYAGGIMILFIMAIFLTHRPGKDVRVDTGWKPKTALPLALTGLVICGYIIVNNVNKVLTLMKTDEKPVQEIGSALMGSGKYQYLLPFEMISILLLACIVGAIMIARKEKNNPNDSISSDGIISTEIRSVEEGDIENISK